jgi:hypothetical protein
MKQNIPSQVEQVPFPELPQRPTNYFKTDCLLKSGKFMGFTSKWMLFGHIVAVTGLGIGAKATYDWVIEPTWRRGFRDFVLFTWNGFFFFF